MSEDNVGRTIGGRYQLLAVLGTGSTSHAYKAIDLRLGRTVAIKVMSERLEDREERTRFLREGEVASGLRHPNLVPVLEAGESDGSPYLVMEYVEGGQLRGALRSGQALDVDQAVEIVRQLGDALAYLHARGLVHRDLKPSNILLRSSDGRVLLADLGLWVVRGSATLTQTGTIFGTPAYMSPEQVMGKPVDSRTDLWALGVIAYEMLTGSRPFAADSFTALLYSIISDPPPSPVSRNPALSSEVARVVIRALEKSPDGRYPSAQAFVRALQAAAAPVEADASWRRALDAAASSLGERPAAPTSGDEQVADAAPASGDEAVEDGPRSCLTLRLSRPETLAPPTREESTVESVPLSQSLPATLALPREGYPAWLLAVTGTERGKQFALADRVVVGRAGEAEVRLADFSVSRRHTLIERRSDGFFASDLGSSNGTLVNGVRVVAEQRLGDRDEIRIGNVSLIFIQAVTEQELTVDGRRRVREFEPVWAELEGAACRGEPREFEQAGGRLVDGPLREAIGYRVEQKVPYYRGIVGSVVHSPMMWIRHSRFPILLIAYDRRLPEVLPEVAKQIEMAKVGGYFALLVVIPTQPRTGDETATLRQHLANSVYRHDFVVLDRDHLANIISKGSSERLVEIMLEQGIDLSTLSPYVVRGPVPELMFFGRERELKAISLSIQGHDYALVGGRRIGKSSILLKLTRVLGYDSRYAPVYLNCEDKFTLEDLLGGLAEALEATDRVGDLTQLRSVLVERRRSRDTRLPVFLLDEVDELLAGDAASGGGHLFKVLRSLSHEGHCRFVFSGSRTLHRHLHDPRSPFFNFCEELRLSMLDGRSVAEVVIRPLGQLGFDLPDRDALIDRMIRLTGGHPNLVQWLCHHLVKTANGRRIDLAHLEFVAGEAAFHNHFLETAWGDSTPLERLLTLVMDEPEFELQTLAERVRALGIKRRTRLMEALGTLELFALLERKGARYRFLLPEFGRIIREARDVSSEIAQLVDEAEA